MAVVTSTLGCKYLLGVYCNFEWPLNEDHLYKHFIFQFVQGCIFPDMLETVTSIQVNFAWILSIFHQYQFCYLVSNFSVCNSRLGIKVVPVLKHSMMSSICLNIDLYNIGTVGNL